MQRTAPAIVLATILASAVYASALQNESPPSLEKGPVRSGVTIREMEALKSLVLTELRNDLTSNGERPSQRYAREQFARCNFRRLSLGKLGNAVLVEFREPEGGPNSGWYIIYLRRNGRYARIAVGSGFGPYVLTGINGIPDLAFGSTSGICHEFYLKLRYSGTSYKPNACVHTDSDANGDNCHPEACDDSRKLPMFAPPDPSAMQ